MEPSGCLLSYGELEVRANQSAHLFRQLGARAGDKVAFCAENRLEIFEFCWAAQRAGLYYVPVSSRLTASEISYILGDCEAKVFLTTDYPASQLDEIADKVKGIELLKLGHPHPQFRDWMVERSGMPESPIADESKGGAMYYSSGTTGRPKGIVPPALSGQAVEVPEQVSTLILSLFRAEPDSVYLCPAPLYHAAPLGWTMNMQRLGATTVVMESYDAEMALALIKKHEITHAQFVPTHFVRMLKLPESVREKSDVSSLKSVVHAAAPCPVSVKQAMIDWWGPIILEYYSGSEGIGMTFITSDEWLGHKGSVGKSVMGKLHICGEHGDELPNGEEGQIFFEGGPLFEYHNDPEKTESSRNQKGWASLGDIGWLDNEGYLYLTDRKNFTIISGGVNIYPQEIENVLVSHPKVMDAAVIGVPDPEMGEKVVAVIQPMDFASSGPDLAKELDKFCRESLSGIKVPRQIDFRDSLPRTDAGKLFKRQLKDEYSRRN